MNYKKLKKDCFAFKDGARRYLIDSRDICASVAADSALSDLIGGASPEIVARLIRGKIDSKIASNPLVSCDLHGFTWGGSGVRLYDVDFIIDWESYFLESGRLSFRVARVVGLRLVSFAPFCGMHDRPDYVQMFGAWRNGQISDHYIKDGAA